MTINVEHGDAGPEVYSYARVGNVTVDNHRNGEGLSVGAHLAALPEFEAYVLRLSVTGNIAVNVKSTDPEHPGRRVESVLYLTEDQFHALRHTLEEATP